MKRIFLFTELLGLCSGSRVLIVVAVAVVIFVILAVAHGLLLLFLFFPPSLLLVVCRAYILSFLAVGRCDIRLSPFSRLLSQFLHPRLQLPAPLWGRQINIFPPMSQPVFP